MSTSNTPPPAAQQPAAPPTPPAPAKPRKPDFLYPWGPHAGTPRQPIPNVTRKQGRI